MFEAARTQNPNSPTSTAYCTAKCVDDENQYKFEAATDGVLISTKAQAFGVNYSNITQVVIWEIPDGIELLYQMVGRASREGVSGEIKIFYSRKMAVLHEQHAHQSLKTRLIDQESYEILQKSITAVKILAETNICRWKTILNYFKEDGSDKFLCNVNCDNCLKETTETQDVTDIALPILKFFIPNYSATLTDIRTLMSGRASEMSRVDLITKQLGQDCNLINLCKKANVSFQQASKILDSLINDGYLQWSHNAFKGQRGTRLIISTKGVNSVKE